MMVYVCGGKDAAAVYSMHSWRAWLASAMAAAGVPDLHIQAALRWASTEALAEYKKTEPAAYGERLLRAERVKLTARMAHHLPRPLPRYESDDLASALLAARQDLIAIGRRDDAEAVAVEARPATAADAGAVVVPAHEAAA